MNTSEIQEAAKEAGIEFCPNWGTTYTGNSQIERFAAIIEKRTIERCAIPDKAMQAIQEACESAMHYTVAARIPECGDFGAIAQHLSYALQEISITFPPDKAHIEQSVAEACAAYIGQYWPNSGLCKGLASGDWRKFMKGE